MEKQKRYITTTLPYVNADPHIGHALELIQADTLARYWRLQLGKENVFFNTGTDEHGQKVSQKADEAGRDRQEYVDDYAARFDKLKEALDLSYDAFIRTTDSHHKTATQEIWRRCDAAGDIYKKSYTGLYCVGCEVFYKESELDENKCCFVHGKPVEEVEEENYFFRLSKYEDALKDYLRDTSRTVPDWQRQWALDFVSSGLEDLSISRRTSRMDWGIPVPDDDEHVMYVWFDALTNYISTLGWPEDAEGKFNDFWVEGETLQVAGKDQIRFQSIIWQAMLISAGIKQTDTIMYHGFINSGGKKMSKSLGNTIDPYEMVKRYGSDATRYILLRHVHSTEDSDLTWEKMDGYYTDNLVNGLGNLVARIMKMAETHLDEPVTPQNARLLDDFGYEFQEAMDRIWHQIGALDEKITETEPFKLVKEDKPAAQQLITELVRGIAGVGEMLQSFMPKAAQTIQDAIKENKKPENLFGRLEN